MHIQALLLSLIHASLLCFSAGTLIKTPGGYKTIEQLSVGDTVLCCDFHNQRVTTQNIQAIRTLPSNKQIRLHIDNDEVLIASPDQLLLDETWKRAKNYGSAELIDQTCILYELSIPHFHNYFVSKHDICAHNFGIE